MKLHSLPTKLVQIFTFICSIQGFRAVERFPQSITIPLQIGYEYKLFRFFGSNHFKAEEFIRKVAAISVDYYIQIQKERNFPVITWKIDKEIARFVNISINSKELCRLNNTLETQKK